MKVLVKRLESLLELGGIKKDIIFLIISGAAVLLSLLDVRPFPFDMAWIAIISLSPIRCGKKAQI